MLCTLVCTMFMTLCVDVGWKPVAEGAEEEVYVIQIHPEQANLKIKEGGYVSSIIPDGVKEVRIQFDNETLAPKPTVPQPSLPNPTENESLSHVIPTSMNSPTTSPITPLESPKPLKESPSTKKTTSPNTTLSEKSESYLTTAIISWIISTALLAMVVYFLWIHFDMRRRYQELLNRTLTDSTDLLSQSAADPLSGKTKPNHFIQTSCTNSAPSLTKEPHSQTSKIPLSEAMLPATSIENQSENASTSEEASEKSTLVESEADGFGESKDIQVYFDKTDRLLENTNRIIAQGLHKSESSKDEKRQIPKLDEVTEELETVYELPETSDDEPPEDEDDAKNWEGVE